MNERRRSSRVPIRSSVQIARPDGQRVTALAYTISFDGLTAKTQMRLPVGEEVVITLSLTLPDGLKRLEAACNTVHSNYIRVEDRYRAGLRFARLESSNFILLERFFQHYRSS